MLKVGRDKVRKWIDKGELRAFDTGFGRHQYRVSQDALDSFMEGRQVQRYRRVVEKII